MVEKEIPVHVREACLKLRLIPSKLSRETVLESWKRLIVPFLGEGDETGVIEINTAKDIIIRWLDDPDYQIRVPLHRRPSRGAGDVALPLPNQDTGW